MSDEIHCVYCEGSGVCSSCEGKKKSGRPTSCTFCTEEPGVCRQCRGKGSLCFEGTAHIAYRRFKLDIASYCRDLPAYPPHLTDLRAATRALKTIADELSQALAGLDFELPPRGRLRADGIADAATDVINAALSLSFTVNTLAAAADCLAFTVPCNKPPAWATKFIGKRVVS